MGRVSGKVALVSGGASGIGRGIVQRLAQEGAKVAITDLAAEAGQALAREIGSAAIFLAQDVTVEADWPRIVAAVQAKFGALHILVNNAGIGGGRQQNPEQDTLENWRRVNQVNLEGVFLGCKYAIPAIHAAGGGSIVNISSLAALIGTPTLGAYGASKAGVRQYSKSVAIHCARKGYNIRCNSIHPGLIQTPLLDGLFLSMPDPERRRAEMAAGVPLGRIGTPEDIAQAALFLASDESKYVTGIELVVDGGLAAI